MATRTSVSASRFNAAAKGATNASLGQTEAVADSYVVALNEIAIRASVQFLEEVDEHRAVVAAAG